MSLMQSLAAAPRHAKDRMCHRYSDINDRTGQNDITGKVVVITGANGGMGEVVALQMAKRGAVVVMACRNVAKAEKAVSSIKEKVPDADLHLIPLDLSDMDSVRKCAAEISEKFRLIHLLINNAGIMLSPTEIERTSAGFERQLATNYLGHVLLTLLLLKQLKAGAPGRIVFVSSFAAEGAKVDPEDLNWLKPKRSLMFMNFGPYNDSKRLVNYFVRELSHRLQGNQINVYSVCPGVADTDLIDNFPPNVKRFVKASKPILGCTAEEAATTIMYCALSEKCRNETGLNYHYEQRYHKADKDVDKDGDLVKRSWVETEKLLEMSFDQFFH